MICKYCGQQIDNNAEYCNYCGRKVLRVPPVFTMTKIGTDVATEAIRSYTEWGFYYNPDAELDPETGQKPDYGYDALEALPDQDHLKWASDFIKVEQMEAALRAEAAAKAEAAASEAEATGTMTEAEAVLVRAGAVLPQTDAMTRAGVQTEAAAAESAGEISDDREGAEESAADPAGEPAESSVEKPGADEPGADASDAGDTSRGGRPKKRVSCAVILIALVFLAAAIAGGAYFLFGADKTYEVDLNELMVQPKVIGYNNFGEMALMPQIDSAKEDEWLRTVDFDNDKENFRKVLDTVTYTPDKTKELSNGDVVTITIDYDKRLAEEKELIVHAQTATFEVKDLEIGKDLAYDPNAYHAYYDDFILPESDRTKLSHADVAFSTNGSISQTQQAINEIYARHGYIFKDEKYDKLFRGFEWYVPMYKPDKFDNGWLNKNEKANLNLLIEYRDELKAAEAKAAEEAAAKEKAEQDAKEKAGKEKAAKEKPAQPAKEDDDD